jgi:hypothetical protein
MPLPFFRWNCEAPTTCATSILLFNHSRHSISLTMSLRDLACYTLTLKPHEQDPKVTELVSVENGREEHRFARVREVRDGEAYSSSIYGMSYHLIYLFWDSGGKGLTIDALTGAKLASVGFISDKQKNRRLQLHNPDESVGFDNTSKMYVYPLKYSD